MNKQQFLAMSLPFGLNGMVDGKSNVTGEFIYTLQSVHYNTEVVEVVGESDFHTEKFKPILHPLSDLIKEIEHKGERFSAIIRLSEMEEIKDIKSFEKFIFSMIEDYFHLPFLFVQQLIEWHFDICGLIESGEAIDINSLSENPYK